ncbi:hypothetical protein KAFR_0A01660 [Kazachstania africana CBS 2517]|uniref:Anaphase-promoting complex subunit 4 WD40 domain-containing protein n=1 Tax=Kazachstania africana (strain ATCC 22294 / BCRC 22015 / CBS 2517 / CECT 1963 / NBRC 1671 / NRRL Y-8276) TaxID=1071382 RepID=H2AMK4_KAZAF|nr:hypothetical protein KAFR_0A01660 [Kazachstania africana CBS 2517]CCF55604.1 hypothetical protein KAFR_0A01660 [Kazachstania africana CBS 2517]
MSKVAAGHKLDFEIPPPDEEEQALAKIVFGDTSDFHTNLSNFDTEFLFDELNPDDGIQGDIDGDLDENEEDEVNLVNDDELFFVDDGTKEDDANEDLMDIDEEDSYESSVDSSDEDENSDAWEDSDDEKLSISVMASNKTKKLRESYNDRMINGKAYARRLRAQFEKIYPRPKWVDDISSDEISSSSEGEIEDDKEQVINGDVSALSKILASTYTYKEVSSSKLLPPKILDIVRLKDANFTHPSHSGIQSLSFHPDKPLLLTGGYDKTLRIYHIDGKNNHLVTSLHLKGTPIQTCTFYVSPLNKASNLQDQKIFTGGRRRYMHSWNLATSNMGDNITGTAKIEKISRLYGHESTQRSFEKFKLAHFHNFTTSESHGIILLQGNSGWINVLHATTSVWMMGCKIEGELVDFCIDYNQLSNGRFQTILIATNTYGEIWEFDLTDNGKILKRWKDEGGIGITSCQVGGGTNTDHFFPMHSSQNKVKSNRWLAIGSESGFVNVYERRNGSVSNNKPIAVLDQLTTTISSLKFSPDGQILCVASRAAKDALRLIHLPSCTVFSNWPTSGTPFGKVTSVSFSPSGEMLAVGNEQGKVRLWRLNHY